MQYVPNKTTICWCGEGGGGGGGRAWGLLRLRQLIAISKGWTTVQIATAKWYTDYHSQALKLC